MKIFLLLFITIPVLLFAQPGINPDKLVEKYFKDNSFPGKEKYLADEMAAQAKASSIGEELAGSAEVNFYPLQSTKEGAVYNINIKKEGTSANFYCYLVNDSGWKISAIRKFILPGYIYSVRDSLAGLKNSKVEEETLLKTLKLMTSDDQTLKDHLNENLSGYSKLIQFYKSSEKEKADKLLHKFGLKGIFEEQSLPGSIFIPIGSVGNSEVGYIFSESGTLPLISPNDFIYIEQIVKNWYVYRII